MKIGLVVPVAAGDGRGAGAPSWPEIQAFGQFYSQTIENIVTNFGAIRDKEQQVSGFSLETVNNRLHIVMRHEFR